MDRHGPTYEELGQRYDALKEAARRVLSSFPVEVQLLGWDGEDNLILQVEDIQGMPELRKAVEGEEKP